MIDYIKVTAENIDEVKDGLVSVRDQAEQLAIGDESWGIMCEGQRGQMSRYNSTGRGAVMFGGDSLWGDWVVKEDGFALLYLDDPGEEQTMVDEEGNMMTACEIQDALRQIMAERN